MPDKLIPNSQFRKMAVQAARAVSDKKGEDILLLDLSRSPSGLSDFLLIASANSQVHLGALRDTVQKTLEGEGLEPIHQEGRRSEQWMVLDYGGILVHLFHRTAREFYSLERIWGEAKKVAWEKPRLEKKKKSSRAKPPKK